MICSRHDGGHDNHDRIDGTDDVDNGEHRIKPRWQERDDLGQEVGEPSGLIGSDRGDKDQQNAKEQPHDVGGSPRTASLIRHEEPSRSPQAVVLRFGLRTIG